jgi:hypothetical protein
MARHCSPTPSALTAIIILIANAPARGQSWPETAAGRQVVSVSGGIGGLIPYLSPERPDLDFVASIQVPLGSSVVVEAEATRSTANSEFDGVFDNRLDRPYIVIGSSHIDHDALNVGVNLRVRKPLGKVFSFVGGGVGIYRMTDRFVAHGTCQARVPQGCNDRPDTTNRHEWKASGPSWQLVGGIDRPITRHVGAFAAARWITAGDAGIGGFGGLRVAVAPAPTSARPPVPRGPLVQIVGSDGGRRQGHLVSLDSSEVAFLEQDRVVSILLQDVRTVQKSAHRVRNGILWGAIGGFVGGYFASCGGGDEKDCWREFGAMMAGPGAVAGAAIGAVMNVTHSGTDLLYSASRSGKRLTPIVAPGYAGVGMALRF